MTERPSAYDQAAKLLARRTHFRRELEAKLRQRDYERDDIEAALDRLEERRYLDDEAAARQYVEGRLARGGYGHTRLRAELAARGVDDGVIGQVLDELLPDDEVPQALEEARRWASRRSKPPDPAAIARRLERRGFSAGAIAAVLRDGAWGGEGGLD